MTVCLQDKDLAATLMQSEVVVVAGVVRLCGADYVRDGQTIIDVGIAGMKQLKACWRC